MTTGPVRPIPRPATLGVAALLTALLLAACSADAEPDAGPQTSPSMNLPSATQVVAPDSESDLAADDPVLDVALSDPRADRVYPEVGHPEVDALHYQLDLAWTPDTDTLDAIETLTFRATTDADRFALDFGASLTAESVTLDGEDVDFAEQGKNLVVRAPIALDERYVLEVRYGGSPKPVAAPTTRSDFSTVGWTVTEDHQVWTMQEPFGAYSWYAVNDHPSDKALYDFTISAPAPMVGVANGTLESRDQSGGTTTTRWHLDEPAASYLVTVAVGDFVRTNDESDSGVPMTYWTPRGDRSVIRRARAAADELDWIEDRLGEYPFSSLGILVVPSRSGMETQTMITLGDGRYTLSPEVIVHEMVHQWYGNQVTPEDWRDMWMNEGMTMYLQALWEADHYSFDVQSTLDDWRQYDQQIRSEAGPPAAYDPGAFGEGNVYYIPALMWHEVRQRLGDRQFWRLAAEWPRSQDNGNASYDDILGWWSDQSGQDLTSLFDAWLLGETTPPAG